MLPSSPQIVIFAYSFASLLEKGYFCTTMKKIELEERKIIEAAESGMDAFVQLFVDAVMQAIDGELTGEHLAELNADQATLLAYHILHEEVMDGGFVQLIHNGYGPFFFHNPFAKVMRMWGVDDLAKLMNKVRKKYEQHHEEIERDCTDEEFMAMFERFPAFDEFDDEFVEFEEEWTAQVAQYIDEHIEQFVVVKK